jgi:hypothetical protein
LSICRKKKWQTFKVQGVKHKKRASLGLKTDFESIYDDEELENDQEVGRDETETLQLGQFWAKETCLRRD